MRHLIAIVITQITTRFTQWLCHHVLGCTVHWNSDLFAREAEEMVAVETRSRSKLLRVSKELIQMFDLECFREVYRLRRNNPTENFRLRTDKRSTLPLLLVGVHLRLDLGLGLARRLRIPHSDSDPYSTWLLCLTLFSFLVNSLLLVLFLQLLVSLLNSFLSKTIKFIVHPIK